MSRAPTMQTIGYRGVWIQVTGDYVHWLDANGKRHATASLRGARAGITRYLKRLGLPLDGHKWELIIGTA